MARDLTKDVAEHDDANSEKHEIDKRAAAARKKINYSPEPAVENVPGASIVDGCFKSPVKGFTFLMRPGCNAKKVDGPAYTKLALLMSAKRRRYVRMRQRDGKTRKDWGEYKHGAVSLVTTLPPWAVRTVGRIGPAEREDLLLRLAEAQARRIEEVSGRPTFGGGCHLDTSVPHWHSHIPKTDENGVVYPKGKFLTGGPWLTGAYRVEQKFPGLLSEWKRKRMEDHIARKRKENLVDLAAVEAIDAELEKWIRERGFQSDYERDCREYIERKSRAQKEEPGKRLIQAALGYHDKTGVWPLAYQAMSFTMWRVIPPELRVVVMLSIRATQMIRKVSRVVGMTKTLSDLAREPHLAQPRR